MPIVADRSLTVAALNILTDSVRSYGGRWGFYLGVLLSLVMICGCVGLPRALQSPERYRHGLVLLLPGIEGRSHHTRNIALGLADGGVSSAIEVWDWTTGLPGGFVYNLVDLERNRQEADRLAQHILAYARAHPGSPVHLIGHSGGGGVAVLGLEALPPEHPIEMAVLLAPALSSDYDLSTALTRTRQGICNCYSENDIVLLKWGTTVFGSIDRVHGEAAGAVGFKVPEGLDERGQALHSTLLRQVRWTPQFRKMYGADGSHLGWASRRFSRNYLAPIIQQNETWRALEDLLGEIPDAAR